MSEAIKNYYSGLKFSEVAPLLKQIAEQNGLKLSRLREFNIAKTILAHSIVKN
jgi:hypothetical protein